MKKQNFMQFKKWQQVVLLALVLILPAIVVMATSLQTKLDTVQNAQALASIQTTTATEIVEQQVYTFDVWADDYYGQLQAAGIDTTIVPSDSSIPSDARLATRMTNTYETYNDWDFTGSTLWTKIITYVTTSQWKHGFLWTQTSCDTTVTVKGFKWGVSGSSAVSVSKADTHIKIHAGDYYAGYNHVMTRENFTDLQEGQQDKNNWTDDNFWYGREEGPRWTHSADVKWVIGVKIIDSNNITQIVNTEKEVNIFVE